MVLVRKYFGNTVVLCTLRTAAVRYVICVYFFLGRIEDIKSLVCRRLVKIYDRPVTRLTRRIKFELIFYEALCRNPLSHSCCQFEKNRGGRGCRCPGGISAGGRNFCQVLSLHLQGKLRLKYNAQDQRENRDCKDTG